MDGPYVERTIVVVLRELHERLEEVELLCRGIGALERALMGGVNLEKSQLSPVPKAPPEPTMLARLGVISDRMAAALQYAGVAVVRMRDQVGGMEPDTRAQSGSGQAKVHGGLVP